MFVDNCIVRAYSPIEQRFVLKDVSIKDCKVWQDNLIVQMFSGFHDQMGKKMYEGDLTIYKDLFRCHKCIEFIVREIKWISTDHCGSGWFGFKENERKSNRI